MNCQAKSERKAPKVPPPQQCSEDAPLCPSFLQKLPAPAAGWGVLLLLSSASCPHPQMQPCGSAQARFMPAENALQKYLASKDQRSDPELPPSDVSSLPCCRWTKWKQPEVYLGKKPKWKGMKILPLSMWGFLLEATLQVERRWASGNEEICDVARWKSFIFKEEDKFCSS